MTTRKPIVKFFPAVVSACGPGASSCCTPAQIAESSDPAVVMIKRVDDVQGHYGDRVDVSVASYDTPSDVDAAIETLNTAFAASNIKMTVTRENFYVVLQTVAPIVLIGDQVALNGLPSWEDLREMVDKSLISA